MMYSFRNDYSEGAHPRLMEALNRTNFEQTIGYGTDDYCAAAAARIREKMDAPDADIHFLVGGTQTNMTMIAAALRSHQAVVAAHTGHVNVHETGAIEATGHKVIAVRTTDGKLTPELVRLALNGHSTEHMVQPKMVYISQTTEVGTVYNKAELEALSALCKAQGLYLYLDGARLASALTSQGCDVTLPDLARLTDAFYIGGTKCGALFGEALVIVNPELKPDFRYHIKQRGGMLAKGRLLGIQFGELFADDLYWELGKHANAMAMKLRGAFAALPMYSDSYSNQQFPIVPDELAEKLREFCIFEVQEKVDATHTAIRFVTSWATREQDVDGFIAAFQALAH